MSRLVSRLKYKYSIKDSLVSLGGLFNRSQNLEGLFSLMNNENIFFVNHARTGIRIALSALELKEKSKVAVPAYNCKTVFNAIKIAGHTPVFIDITDDFQIDLEDLSRKSKEVDALVLTHLFGITSDIAKIKEILAQVPIIEDCAHSFLSKYKGQLTGSFGDIAVFSFGKGKFPSIGDGGFMVVNNNDLIHQVSSSIEGLPEQGFFTEVKNVAVSLVLSTLTWPLIYGNITSPYLKKIIEKNDIGSLYSHNEKKILRTNLSLFLSKIKSIHTLVPIKKSNGISNVSMLEDNVQNTVKPIISNNEWNYFMYPVLINEGREDAIDLFKKKSVELGKHFSKSLEWATSFGYKKKSCPNAESIAERIITVPTYYRI